MSIGSSFVLSNNKLRILSEIYLSLVLKLITNLMFSFAIIPNLFYNHSEFTNIDLISIYINIYYILRISYYQKFNFIEEIAYEKNSKIISLRYYKYGGFARDVSRIDMHLSEVKVYTRQHFRTAAQTFLIIKHNKKRYIFGDYGLNKVMFNSLVNQLKGKE